MDYLLYEKAREEWKDKPDRTTPVNARSMNHIEDGIYKNSENIIKLARGLEGLCDTSMAYDEAMEILNEESGGY